MSDLVRRLKAEIIENQNSIAGVGSGVYSNSLIAEAADRIAELSQPWISVDEYRNSHHHGLVVFYDSLEPSSAEVRRSDCGSSEKIEPDLVFLLPPIPTNTPVED